MSDIYNELTDEELEDWVQEKVRRVSRESTPLWWIGIKDLDLDEDPDYDDYDEDEDEGWTEEDDLEEV